jgi:hypothetical protein
MGVDFAKALAGSLLLGLDRLLAGTTGAFEQMQRNTPQSARAMDQSMSGFRNRPRTCPSC